MQIEAPRGRTAGKNEDLRENCGKSRNKKAPPAIRPGEQNNMRAASALPAVFQFVDHRLDERVDLFGVDLYVALLKPVLDIFLPVLCLHRYRIGESEKENETG